ncbi:hypothetical protein [Acinetobacter baumannii]|uniref:hypothetical protein n=1 Tax=Acinetobacter baumannii TaxID=470 RepID=UPI00233103FF|nr:hypothetical protein [Acinetobacter baumannii]
MSGTADNRVQHRSGEGERLFEVKGHTQAHPDLEAKVGHVQPHPAPKPWQV